MTVCARCRRPLTREPVVVNGHGYGARCASLVGDLLTQLARDPAKPRKPRQRKGDQHPDLFTEVRP